MGEKSKRHMKIVEDEGDYADGWRNFQTKLGTKGDKSTKTRFDGIGRLDDEELEVLYEDNALAARVIDRLPDDATREGFEITEPDQEFDVKSLNSQLEDLEAHEMMGNTWRWARQFGGAIMIMAVNDGLPFDMPLDLDNARKLSGLSVIDKRFVFPDFLDPGLGSRGFMNPKHYNIHNPLGRQGHKRVHRSRVIRFDGIEVAPFSTIKHDGWGPSILQRIYITLRRLGSVRGYGEHIIHHASVLVMKIHGMKSALKGNKDAKKKFQDFITEVQEAFDVLHILSMDSTDEISRNETQALSGLTQVLERYLDDLVSETDEPRSILLGESPGGLNTGENAGEIRAWYDHVKAQQKKILTKRWNRLLTVIFAIRRNRGETVPTEWKLEYKPLWQMDEMAMADIRLKNAQSDKIYWEMGSVNEAQVSVQRFVEGNTGDLEVSEKDAAPGLSDLPAG